MKKAKSAKMVKADGGCLCGAVRYKVEFQPSHTGHCHCATCRRASGAPYVTWFSTEPTALKFTKGRPKYFSSSAEAKRGFCAKCGTQIIFKYSDPKRRIGVTAGSLDKPSIARPVEQIFWKDRVASHLNTDLPKVKF